MAATIMGRRDAPIESLAIYGEMPLAYYSAMLGTAPSPFKIEAWSYFLQHYPDPEVAQDIINGMIFGEKIGFNGPPGQVITLNSKMSEDKHDFFEKDIERRLKSGQIIGPFDSPPTSNFRCSPLIAVKKSSGSFRGVHDLSKPKNASVNDYIEK